MQHEITQKLKQEVADIPVHRLYNNFKVCHCFLFQISQTGLFTTCLIIWQLKFMGATFLTKSQNKPKPEVHKFVSF